MEMDNLRKRIKVKVDKDDDFYELYIKAIRNTIDRYEVERFENIHREKILIKDILEACKDVDKETKLKYSNILAQLEIEQRSLFQKCMQGKNKKDEKKEEIEK